MKGKTFGRQMEDNTKMDLKDIGKKGLG